MQPANGTAHASFSTVILACALVAACGGGGGGGEGPSSTAPTLDLALSANVVRVGETAKLSWSAGGNVAGCTSSGDWHRSASALSGEVDIAPAVGGRFTYSMTCTGAGGTVVRSVVLAVPLPVARSSYENKINAGKVIGQQQLPFAWMGRGYAFADFWQEGEYTLVKNIESSLTTLGRLAFYKKVEGVWVERTAELLADTTGCVVASKMLVADFNGDKKPDVFLSCSGIDLPPFAGEAQRLLVSRADGKYDNRVVAVTAYAHGGSAVDAQGTGHASVVLTDTSVRERPFYLRNNRDGSFAEVPGVLPASVQPVQLGQLEALPIYSAEFIDINADGRYDLWFGGSSGSPFLNYLPSFYTNNGSDQFTDAGRTSYTPAVGDVTALDIVWVNGNAYTLYSKNDYQSLYIDRAVPGDAGAENLYTHTGPYPGVNMTWFAWMHLTTDNRLVSPEIGFNVAVPLR